MLLGRGRDVGDQGGQAVGVTLAQVAPIFASRLGQAAFEGVQLPLTYLLQIFVTFAGALMSIELAFRCHTDGDSVIMPEGREGWGNI